MEKNITVLLKWLKIEFFAVWLFVAGFFVLGLCDALPTAAQYGIQPGSETDYYANVICVCLVIVFVPLSLKLFALNTRKGLRWLNYEEALVSYHIWSAVKMTLLLVCAACGIFIYWFLENMSGLLCACMAMAVFFTCWPSDGKIRQYLKSRNEEKQEAGM